MKTASLIIGILLLVSAGGAWAQETVVFKQSNTVKTSDGRAGVAQSPIDKNIANVNLSAVTVPVGTSPQAVAVNPLTNKIYVANRQSSNVTVIDGTNNSTVTVAAGSGASHVAVNTVTNKIYVTNLFAGTVTVIDGSTNSTVTVAVGSFPVSLAINPLTNKIYVANQSSDSVTVIDGADHSTTNVPVGSDPRAVVVNSVTNKIYVTARGSDYLAVIDGADNSVARIIIEPGADVAGINPVTNKIYVAGSVFFGVIDGASNTATTEFFGSPTAIAVNPITNRIYINDSYGAVGIIDGADDSTTFIELGSIPGAIAVNPATGKIYIPARNRLDTSLKIIDGANNSMTTVTTGGFLLLPSAVAVNPVTNKIYVVNSFSNDVSVVEDANNPSAAFTVGGRVAAAGGRGIGNVSLLLMDAHGRTHTARTNQLGYYRFDKVPYGTSIIGASATKRRVTFAAERRAVNITDNLGNIDFTVID